MKKHTFIICAVALGAMVGSLRAQTTLEGDQIIAGNLQVGTTDDPGGESGSAFGSINILSTSGNVATTFSPDGSFLFSGAPGGGAFLVPAVDEGANFVWDPNEAAIVGGGTSPTDETYIGQYSLAFGNFVYAAGQGSIATGEGSWAGGQDSAAFGASEADGQHSTAFGQSGAYADDATAGGNSYATNDNATAFGEDSTASGEISEAMGFMASASGYASFAAGFEPQASGDYSVALGSAYANNYDTVALGSASAQGEGSVAIGTSTANGGESTALGFGVQADAYGSTTLGAFNLSIAGTDPSSWEVNDPLLVVGNGTYSGRHNALVMLKNGKISLYGAASGTTPTIVFDPNVPSISVNGASVLAPNYAGNVGIGTGTPLTKLQVVGRDGTYGQETLGGASDAGMLTFRSGASGGAATGQIGYVASATEGNLFDIASNSTSGAIRLDTAGTERLRIDSSGNVGIGTNSSNTALNVKGVVSVFGATQNSTAASSNGDIIIPYGQSYRSTNDSNNTSIGLISLGTYGGLGNSLLIGNTSATAMSWPASIQFRTSTYPAAAAERMRIDATGNVGIGTTAPAAPLDVQAVLTGTPVGVIVRRNGNQFININENDGGAHVIAATSPYNNPKPFYISQVITGGAPTTGQSDMIFSISQQASTGSTMVFQANTGNLGIGSFTPAAKLDVSGNAAIGTGITGTSYSAAVVGAYNRPEGSTTAWSATDPAFTVANGTGVSTDPADKKNHNAFVVYKNGTANLYANGTGATTASPTIVLDPNAKQISVGGVSLLAPNLSGNLGLGTGASAPLTRLQVVGRTGSYGQETLGATSDAGLLTFLRGTDGSVGAQVGYGTSAGEGSVFDISSNGSSGAIRLSTNGSERLRVDGSGNVGIGTSTPTAQLDVKGNNGVLFEGTFGSGTFPTSTSNSLLIWYSKKSALLAGAYLATDDTGIGDYSVALGIGSQAPGVAAVSLAGGYAAGGYSMAFAGGDAEGGNSFAFGASTLAGGDQSIAFGGNSTVDTYCGMSFGFYNTVSGGFLAIGVSEAAVANNAMAIGIETEASGQNSLGMGTDSVASGDFSTTFGYSNTASSYGSTSLGIYGLDGGGAPSTWVATDPLLNVGNGGGDNGQHSAMVMLKNGQINLYGTYSTTPKIVIDPDNSQITVGGVALLAPTSAGNFGIGTTTPASKLSVYGTGGTDGIYEQIASSAATGERLQSGGTTNAAYTQLYQGTTGMWEYGADGSNNFYIQNATNSGSTSSEFLINRSSGNVGIGTDSPQSRLAVNGNAAIGTGVSSNSAVSGQVVVGAYNNTSTSDSASTPATDHTQGVLVVGAGTSATHQNAIRVLSDGTVLVKNSGDIDMGAFQNGPRP